MIDFNTEISKFKPALPISNVAGEVKSFEKEDIFELLKKVVELKES